MFKITNEQTTDCKTSVQNKITHLERLFDLLFAFSQRVKERCIIHMHNAGLRTPSSPTVSVDYNYNISRLSAQKDAVSAVQAVADTDNTHINKVQFVF